MALPVKLLVSELLAIATTIAEKRSRMSPIHFRPANLMGLPTLCSNFHKGFDRTRGFGRAGLFASFDFQAT
jgi:hypothetical protein